MFKKLKGTFQKSQQDFVNGLRSLASFDVHSRHDQLQHIRSKDINLNVGADLLYSYQESWSLIQTQTKECADKAEKFDDDLDPLLMQWEIKTKVVTDLENEVQHIPKTVSSLKEIRNLIGTLRQDFAIVEKSLDILENLCEELDLHKHVAEEQKKLAHYSALKMAQAEKVKVDLAHKHLKRMSDLEVTKRINLQERREAFTSAFQEDVKFFKAHGHADVCKLPTEFPKVSSLSEIEIDQDKNALDSFLDTTEPDSQAAEPETDEPYFEDDYTSDYSIKQDDEFIDENDLKSPLFDTVCENDDDDDEDSGKVSLDSNMQDITISSEGMKISSSETDDKINVSSQSDSNSKIDPNSASDNNNKMKLTFGDDDDEELPESKVSS